MFDSEMYSRFKEHLYNKRPVLGEDSPFSELLQNMVNEMLEGEMESFIEQEGQTKTGNKRNGKSTKKVRTNSGDIYVTTPSDRKGLFEPELIPKCQQELNSSLHAQILALYAQDNSVEDVKRLLLKMYGVEISAGIFLKLRIIRIGI